MQVVVLCCSWAEVAPGHPDYRCVIQYSDKSFVLRVGVMVRDLVAVILSGLWLTLGAGAQSGRTPAASMLPSNNPSADSATIPPAPKGKSTIFGGEIRDMDPVRDQLTLKVYGERPMKILFDERTEVYRDGTKVSLGDLHAEEHASIQTTLDGTKLFAVSIHTLSRSQEGEYEGRVLRFDPGTGELTVASGQSRETVRLLVQSGTPVVRKGQNAFSSERSGTADLVIGSLVAVQFRAGGKGDAVASQVEILAVPGSTFVFSGSISSLDLHSGTLVLIDPRGDKNYQVSFDPDRLPASRSLHLGENARVVANYDGLHYVASEIAAN